ncbi:GW dipeptide domain-containing protein, partial [Listeria monocytogenes]|nr:GW dipeptide domain-containing protein [Listeria monocytogenes]
KPLLITREGKTASAKWYYCKLGNTTIGWIASRAFTNIGKPTIADAVPALWNRKKAIITTKPKSTTATTYFFKKNSAGNRYEV